MKPTTLCLTFHDIIPERNPQSLWFDCSVSELESELDWLKRKGAHFITVFQLFEHLTKGANLPSKPVCVTFADNYLGFYSYGYPIVKSRHIPTAMFVHTGFVGSPVGRPKMSWEQLNELQRGGLVSVESQTVTHPPDLRTLSDKALATEMRQSRQSISKHVGHSSEFLAYPNGKYDDRCANAAKVAGYKMAFTEQLTSAESSPSIFEVSRYVHTKYLRGWREVMVEHRR